MQERIIAQDGKPTKEQTINWLYNNYPKEVPYSNFHKGWNIVQRGKILTFLFKINKDSLYISYRDSVSTMGYVNENKILCYSNYRLALKDIESIQLCRDISIGLTMMGQYEECNETALFPYYLLLKAKDNKPLFWQNVSGEICRGGTEGANKFTDSARIPFGNDTKSSQDALFNSFRNTQLFKAFEHLRKLCGATDPIQF